MNTHSVTSVITAMFVFSSSLVSQARISSASPVREPDAIIPALAGSWRFDIYESGQTTPISTGRRQMRLLSDSTKLVWTETFNSRSDTGTGILGYDSRKGLYYLLGAYTHEPHPVAQVGRAGSSGRSVVFDSTSNVAVPGVFITSELRLVDSTRFEWIASDRSWRAVFTRITGP
jgi:hypothetical protein